MQCVNGSSSQTSWMDQLDRPARQTSWTDQLERPAGWTSLTDQLDGLAGQTSLTGQLDGPAGQTSWTDQLDRPAGRTSYFYLKPWPVHLFEDFPFSFYIVAASESDKGLVFTQKRKHVCLFVLIPRCVFHISILCALISPPLCVSLSRSPFLYTPLNVQVF